MKTGVREGKLRDTNPVGREPPPPPPLSSMAENCKTGQAGLESKDDISGSFEGKESKWTKPGENSGPKDKQRQVEDSEHLAQVRGETGHPPVGENGHKTSHQRTLSLGMAPPPQREEPEDRSRDIPSGAQGYDEIVDNITIVKPRPTIITINGIPLKDVKKKGRQPRASKTTPSKRKLETTKKNVKTTTPSVEDNRKIWEYMVRKKAKTEDNKDGTSEDNVVQKITSEDLELKHPSRTTTIRKSMDDCEETKQRMNVKTTFGSSNSGRRNNKVGAKILKFQELVDGDDCVVRSGYCVTHNLKTIREIVSVRTSCVDKNAKIGWRLSESAVMCCPRAQLRKPTSAKTTGQTLSYEAGKTNGKYCEIRDDDIEPIT